MKLQLAFVVVLAATATDARAVTIDLVPVGNPGNVGEIQPGGVFGRVTTSYQIGKYEVTNAQYVEFLNAKAASDPLSLYHSAMGALSDGGITRSGAAGSYTYAVKTPAIGAGPGGSDYTYGDKPVNYVSWYDAVRFANWMSNGQGAGNTESGAYTLLGGTATPSNADSISRNAGVAWFLPSEHEWYKAAYYNGASSSYFDYPTGTDIAPDNNLPTAESGNSANFLGADFTTGDSLHPLTATGAYLQSESAYGTFDQGGNIAEWNEALVAAGKRGRRGGAWDSTVSVLSSATRESKTASSEDSRTGFRLAAPASVPGDYSGNGVVDAADYVLWRDRLGTSFQLPNEVAGATPGNVTQEDYTEWRSRFGNTSGAGVGSGLVNSHVPEPAACLLLLSGLAPAIMASRLMCRR